MSTTHQSKAGGKPGQRSRKADQRGRKSDQQQSPKLDQQDANEQIHATVASTDVSTDASTNGAVALADAPSISTVAPADTPSITAVAPADNLPISIQTIANAYGDYTKKSLHDTRSFVEKLMGVRSLDKAVVIQIEFARQAYETFVAESQKISGLYGEIAKQIFKPWEGFVAKVTPAGR